MKILEDNLQICTFKTEYTFRNKIGEDAGLLVGFNSLAMSTFGISFSAVGGEYEPQVLAIGDMVCANVSVNRMVFYHRGRRLCYIQLGTVMTDPLHRGCGLCRRLLEHVLAGWRGRCDGIYLFANDSVLDLYPKFGFVKALQYEYTVAAIQGGTAVLLDMADERSVRLLLAKYEQGNPFSALCMAENKTVLLFYCEGIMKENVYYSRRYDVVIIAQKAGEKALCHDIFGATSASLGEVLGEIGEICGGSEVVLGFTPLDTAGSASRLNIEEDTTLFVLEGGEFPFEEERLMFPTISHA